ncbi:MAG: hypothetical protein HWD63_13375 [Candidatus Parvibacillus calidus]|nr:MAG: hypothetical protein HWD63_13375 [Candidatus Parvibacillus calidus]
MKIFPVIVVHQLVGGIVVLFYFREKPPDVQPSGSWEVRKPANNGDTYLGMVVRENDTWESVSQQLSGTLKKGKTYTFDLFCVHLKCI